MREGPDRDASVMSVRVCTVHRSAVLVKNILRTNSRPNTASGSLILEFDGTVNDSYNDRDCRSRLSGSAPYRLARLPAVHSVALVLGKVAKKYFETE